LGKENGQEEEKEKKREGVIESKRGENNSE